MEGYHENKYQSETKRYCQTLDLKNDPEIIAEYRKRHSETNAWKEIIEGIKTVGILEMEIYIRENRLFMIIETPLDFDWNKAMRKLAVMPRQQEWENYMSIFQLCKSGETSAEKWKPMERMFHLY